MTTTDQSLANFGLHIPNISSYLLLLLLLLSLQQLYNNNNNYNNFFIYTSATFWQLVLVYGFVYKSDAVCL